MTTILNERPFTRLLESARDRRRYTYQEMATRSGGVRSQAWFYKQLNEEVLVNSAPVGEAVWSGLAHLLEVSEAHVRQAIAEEWLGVRNRRMSARVEGIAGSLDLLNESDFRLVAEIVERLPKEDPFGFDHEGP